MIRKLACEALESRRLLAVDCLPIDLPIDDSQTAEISTFSSETVIAADAGGSRATAANIGSIDGTIRLNGSLSWTDRVDTIAFTVDRDAEVSVNLSGLNRNADLYLSDARGQLIGQSTRSGSSVEQISVSLEAGDYYVTVLARSFRSIQYRLSISAELESVPTPVAVPTPETETQTPSTNVTRLSDVAYFGGTREWNLNAIGAPEAWAAGYTGQGVIIAIVDTGVDLDHPDLVNNLFVNAGEIAGNGIDDDGNGFVDDVHGYDFADRDADPNDISGHGTHVAGTIAAGNNGFGATGVAPDATILPVRVFGASGSGSTLDVAAGIRYAADLGADIINLSLGGGYSRAIELAIDYARSLGSFIVAAAGNESAATPGYPARFSSSDDNVISVGAYSSSGNIAGFSNDVGASRAVQVDAPGVGVFSTYVGGRYATLSGTSMAAPHVAGLAALTLSANPALTTRELRDLLASGTIGRANGSDAIGSVNATTSVAYAAAGITGGTSLANARAAVSASSGVSVATSRATAVDELPVSVDLIDANKTSSVKDKDLIDKDLIDKDPIVAFVAEVTAAKRLISSSSQSQGHQQEAEAVDVAFSEYSAEEDNADQEIAADDFRLNLLS